MSILQSGSFDLALFRTTDGRLKDCKIVLKRGAEEFFKGAEDSRDMSSKWKKNDNVKVVRYGRNAVNVLRRQVSLTTVDRCMSFRPSGI